MKIAVLGANGMLGSMITKVLSADPDLEILPINKKQLNAEMVSSVSMAYILEGCDWVINCIGIIKPYIKDNAGEAILVNSLFPHTLSQMKHKIIQIATDCVFSGKVARYDSYNEESAHDALDIYGKTKSLGEIKRDGFYNIRCSIIGPQENNPSLLQWFLDLPKGSKIKGFHQHLWNGITTLAFANVCRGIIEGELPDVNNFNLVPANTFTKYQLLELFKEVFNRPDIEIEVENTNYCNRSLTTIYPENNIKMWKQAGYQDVPTIQELLNQLKETL